MREKFSRFIKSNGSSKKVLPIFLLVMFLGLFILVKPVHADFFSYYIWIAISLIAEAIAYLAGMLLLFVINFLINVSGYNNFINASVVDTGWKLVRDVANMFFILIMLVMAFGTMLKLEQYSWKKMLPRLVGTAILINFSKTIIGLLIDFGQVIMLTFVNAYAATAGGNFAQMFGIKDVLALARQNISDKPDENAQAMKMALGFVLGAVVLTVSTIVTAIFAFILLFRVVALWILIVLSPLAFLLGTFEKGKEYYRDWWKELINNILVGPIVAFFLWLSLATMGQGGMMTQIKESNALPPKYINQAPNEEGFYEQVAGTEISRWENLGSLCVALAMLFYALDRIQKLGVAGGGLASGASSWMKKTATSAVKKVAIPAALTVATGGAIPTAMALRGFGKAGIGALQGLPIIGGAFKALAKEGDKYGLASEKGIGGFAGRKGAAGISIGKEAALSAVGRIPVVGALVGTAARGAAAELKSERLKPAREVEKRVGEYKDKDVIASAKQKAATSETQQEKFSAIGRILNEPQIKKQVSSSDLQKMTADLPALGEKLGRGDKVAGMLKTFYKENPQFAPPEAAKGKPGEPGYKPAKSTEEKIHELVTGGNGLALSADALSRPEVVKELSQPQREKILKEGDADQQRALGLSLLAEQTGIKREDLGNASPSSTPTDLEVKVDGALSSLPEGSFKQLGNIFDLLLAGLQAKIASNNPEVVAARHLADTNLVDPTDPSKGTKGEDLARQIATTASDTAIQQLSTRLGDQFRASLTSANSATALDGRALNVLASMQRDSAALLNLFRSGGAGTPLDPTKLANAIRASNAHLMLKKIGSEKIIETTSANPDGIATDAGKAIYNNISISMLSKIIGEAKKPGASGSLKETVASIAALVEKATTPDPTTGAAARILSKTEANQLKKLLESQSTIEAIDMASKSGADL